MKSKFTKSVLVNLIFALALLLLIIIIFSAPRLTGVSLISPDNKQSSINMPFFREAPTGNYTLTGSFFFIPWLQHNVSIIPDDCLLSISVNGIQLNSDELIPEDRACDFNRGFSLDLSKIFQLGSNKIEFIIKNTGGPVGLKIRRGFSEIQFILMINLVLILFLLVRILGRPRSFIRKTLSTICYLKKISVYTFKEHSNPSKKPSPLQHIWLNCSILFKIPWLGFAALLTALLYLRYGYLAKNLSFDPDELSHVHSAWCIAKGLLPYRDYFDHHMPLLHLLLSPVLLWLHPENGIDQAVLALTVCRILMWIFLGLTLLLVIWIGKRIADIRVGIVASLFLAINSASIDKALEIRPDVPAMALWALGLGLIITAHQISARLPKRSVLFFILSGITLGSAFLFTQKIVFALIGLEASLLLRLFYGLFISNNQLQRKQHLGEWLAHAVSGFLPFILCLSFYAIQGSTKIFLDNTILVNLAWKYSFAPFAYLDLMIRLNPVEFGCATVGFLAGLLRILSLRAILRGEFILILSTIGGLAGLLLSPVSFLQYYLILTPITSLLAALFLTSFCNRLLQLFTAKQYNRYPVLLGLLIEVLIISLPLIFGLHLAQDELPVRSLYLPLLILSLLFCSATIWHNRDRFAPLMVLLIIAAYPIRLLLYKEIDTNKMFYNELKIVMELTTPTSTVMDGFSGLGVFRPHAWRYFFLHHEIRSMLSENEVPELLEALTLGKITPILIVLDSNLKALGPEFIKFVKDKYTATTNYKLWLCRKMD